MSPCASGTPYILMEKLSEESSSPDDLNLSLAVRNSFTMGLWISSICISEATISSFAVNA
jgi:hypothetical protein